MVPKANEGGLEGEAQGGHVPVGKPPALEVGGEQLRHLVDADVIEPELV